MKLQKVLNCQTVKMPRESISSTSKTKDNFFVQLIFISVEKQSKQNKEHQKINKTLDEIRIVDMWLGPSVYPSCS